jgi:hypothetical protein
MKVKLEYYCLDIAELTITLEGREVSNDFIIKLVKLLRQQIDEYKDRDGKRLFDEK